MRAGTSLLSAPPLAMAGQLCFIGSAGATWRTLHDRNTLLKQSFFNHRYDNGLTLVAESMPSLESAALSILVPAGCAYDPGDRLGLSTLTCEMVLRGAGSRDSRQFVEDLENLGVQRGESVSASHTSLGPPRWLAICQQHLPFMPTCEAAAFAGRPNGSRPHGRRAGIAGHRRRSFAQGDAGNATPPLSRAMGCAPAKER